MTARWAAWLAWWVWLITLALMPVILAFDLAARTSPHIVVGLGFGSAFALCGAIVVSRRRVPRIGWLLLAIGASATLAGLTGAYRRLLLATNADSQFAGMAATVGDLAWVLMVALFTLLIQIFPTGRPLGSRWRPLTWLTAAWLLIAVGFSLSVLPGERATAQTLLLRAAAILGAASAISVVVRFVRARGDERQQLKWFAFATGAAIFPFAITFSGAPWLGAALNVTSYGWPLAIGIAILRYRLYDIDVLINRTLVYGVVSATLLATYFGGVVLLQTLLRPFTSGSELAVAGSTLLVVTLFQPVRRRIQDAVDQRFYRSRYDAARTFDAFGARLRNEVDLDSVRADLLGVVGDTVRPAHASLWLRETR